EMSARYGKSWGGYFWAVAEPAGGIGLLALVFSYALRNPPLGNSFMVFYATGIIPFFMYGAVSTSVANAVQGNRGLLVYPVVSALDTVLARLVLETLNYVMVAVVLFPFLIYFDRAVVSFDAGNMVLAMTMAVSMGLGVGTVNCVVIGFFPTWRNIWAVLNRPLFIMSGVLFTYDMVPEPLRSFLWYNPLIHVIGQARTAFYGSYEGEYISHAYLFGVAFSLFVVGAYLLRRHEGPLTER
ncbi:MAG TPA: ABC transporter permease, partial [Paracoccaceae bacterium]